MEGGENSDRHTSRRLWPDEDWGPWRLDFEWRRVGGLWVFTTLAIGSTARPDDADDPLAEAGRRYDEEGPPRVDEPNVARQLRARDLKRLRLADVLRREAENDNPPRADVQDAPEVLVPRRLAKPGRRGPQHYAQVARVYAEALTAGRLDPTRAVAQKFFDVGYPSAGQRSTAAKWVAKARRLGFLYPTERRRAGNVPPVAHVCGLMDRPGPPFLAFERMAETQFCLWQACPDDADLAALNAAIQGDLGGERLARVVVRHFGYQLSPAEENLLARWLAEDTGPDFWEVVRKEGLYYERKEDDSDKQVR